MRLLYLTRSYTAHDARWLRALAGKGFRLGFLPLQPVDVAGFGREQPGVDLLASPVLSPVAGTSELDDAVPVLRRQLRAWGPEVIVAGPLTDAGYLATRVAAEITLLMSWAFDVLHEMKTDTSANERLRRTLTAGRHLFADSESLLARCEALAGKKFANTCILPWGLADSDKPVPSLGWRKRLGDERARVILSPRGFSPVHRSEIVLESFSRAYAKDAKLRLWLAGDGVQRERAERLVDALGLRSVVRFLGLLDQADLAGCFAETDVHFSCADSDGASLSLLQAMHAGLPCVVTDLPGNREWVEPVGGWFAASGDVESFAHGLLEATSLSPEVRANVADCHRLRIGQRADLSVNLPRLLSTIRAVAAGSRISGRQLVAV